MSLLSFWALNVSVALLSTQCQKALGFHQKYFNLWSEGPTGLDDVRVSTELWWTIPLNRIGAQFCRAVVLKTYFSVRECSRSMMKHPQETVVYSSSSSHQKFAFSCSVWKGLYLIIHTPTIQKGWWIYSLSSHVKQYAMLLTTGRELF